MKKHFLDHNDAKVTHWKDDFDHYRWDIVLTHEFLVTLPKNEYEKLLRAFKTIGGVLENATREA